MYLFGYKVSIKGDILLAKIISNTILSNRKPRKVVGKQNICAHVLPRYKYLEMVSRMQVASQQIYNEKCIPCVGYTNNGIIYSVVNGNGCGVLAWIFANGNCDIHIATSTKNNEAIQNILQVVLLPIIRELYLKKGFLVMHAAGLCSSDGVGVLLVGNSGGGKTTTSISLMAECWHLISDDIVATKYEYGEIETVGLEKSLNIRPRTFEYFSDLKKIPDRHFTSQKFGKRSIHSKYLHKSVGSVDSITPKIIYFLNITSGIPSVKKISVTETISRIAISHTFSITQQLSGVSIKAICEIASNVAAYQLNTGSNPAKLGGWISEHCRQLVSLRQTNYA